MRYLLMLCLTFVFVTVVHADVVSVSSNVHPYATYDEVIFYKAADGSWDTITITILRTSSTNLRADYDWDGYVDGTDFATWQSNYPTTNGYGRTNGDFDGDDDVDGADFLVWQQEYPSEIDPLPHQIIGAIQAPVMLFGTTVPVITTNTAVARTDYASVMAGQPHYIDLLENDIPYEDQKMWLSSISNGQHGVIDIDWDNGGITYTADIDYEGWDILRYTLNSGEHLEMNSARIYLWVSPHAPEPSTMLLLSAGTLFLLKRRNTA